MVSHAGLAQFAASVIERCEIGVGSRILQFASPSFDAWVLELCATLLSGATLVVSNQELLAAERLADVLAGSRITHALIPPSMLATVPEPDFPDLHTLMPAGEACSPHGGALEPDLPPGEWLRTHRDDGAGLHAQRRDA